MNNDGDMVQILEDDKPTGFERRDTDRTAQSRRHTRRNQGQLMSIIGGMFPLHSYSVMNGSLIGWILRTLDGQLVEMERLC